MYSNYLNSIWILKINNDKNKNYSCIRVWIILSEFGWKIVIQNKNQIMRVPFQLIQWVGKIQ
jgi:hypothetical protein